MGKKPEVSARETFVLEDDMIDELDEMSWTSVIRDAEEADDESDATAPADSATSDSDELVFDALNAETAQSDAPDSDQDDDDDDGPLELTLMDD